MPPRETDSLLRVSSFVVLIGDREIGFAEVSPLSSMAGPDIPGAGTRQRGYAPVVLRRALTTSTELYDWRRLYVEGEDEARDVTIRQLSAPGGTVVNQWKLVGAWPSRWTGPAFNAMSNEIAFEELEVQFDELVWHGQKPTKKERGRDGRPA